MSNRYMWLIIMVGLIGFTTNLSARSWTSKDGKVIEADFKGFSGTANVFLKSAKTGKIFEVPIDTFSTNDQLFLDQIRAEIKKRDLQEKAAVPPEPPKPPEPKADDKMITALNSQNLEEGKDAERGVDGETDIVYLIGLGLLIIGGGVLVIGWLMMLIEALKCGILWAAVTLIPAAGWILFALTNWQVAKKPLLIKSFGIFISLGGAYLAKMI